MIRPLLLSLSTTLTLFANSPEKPDFSIGTFWESKYVSEGRDNLGKGGLATLEAAAEWSNFALSTWLVNGTEVDYQELQFTAEYRSAVNNVEFYTGYTRLQFPADDAGDNELTAGLAFAGLPYVTPAVDYVFSTEASGGFLEISLGSEQPLMEEQLILTPYILKAFDFGYVSEEYNGFNNFQLGVEVAVPFTETFGFAGLIGHSIALEDVDRDGQGNVSWFTIGLTGAF